ncbi:MAG: site-specific integrase [Propionibacteriaceae bacterium]|nr:site-specific integrase [Propionibacteriaceae bacterium]
MMAIEKLPSGRFRAKVKAGREVVDTRTFDTRREAVAWHDRQKALLGGGFDPRAGKAKLASLLSDWAQLRHSTVAAKTARTDAELLRLVPPSLGALAVGVVQPRHVERWFLHLHSQGLSVSSITRHRASLSAFFGWCTREGYTAANPVMKATVPRFQRDGDDALESARPFTEAELEEVYEALKTVDATLAAVILIAGWTGLRWGELRSMQVKAFQQVPTPGLRVTRSQTEGGQVKAPKSYETRRVPLANRVLPLVEAFAAGKGPDDLLFTGARGGQLWRGSLVRTLNWDALGRGRRIHDLRHTAACLWLAHGVDPGTVQGWMGHESIRTTNRYLHFMGSASDSAGLDLLNAPSGSIGGPRRKEEAG